MQVYHTPTQQELSEILKRPVKSIQEIEQSVLPVINHVKQRGDHAIKEYTQKFDGTELTSIKVTDNEIQSAIKQIPEELKNAIDTAYNNIYTFHAAQHSPVNKIETMPGVVCWRKSIAIEKVGFYIPGGTAPLFSTVLMLGVPASIAGCAIKVVCTPPDKQGNIHPAILYTAHKCGITQIYKCGGSQAIAAMAYGTETIPQVYKIFGPGNQYVMAAKQLVSKDGVAIDMPAGPSEVLVIADATANPAFVAADLLSQAEHGPDSQVILLTTHQPLIEKVNSEIARQLRALPRHSTAQKALENSKIIYVPAVEQAIEISNIYAPEHLILAVKNPEDWAEKVVNAGSVFLGHYTPESAGDYASGTNHTLPTNGYAKAYSGVSLDSFVKKVTFQQISQQGIAALGATVATMAHYEQLDAHKQAVVIRR